MCSMRGDWWALSRIESPCGIFGARPLSSKLTMKPWGDSVRLIETDAFPFEFLSQLPERESWRKEVHRPIYHVHKWWAKRLGSVFRGILLGATLPPSGELAQAFYRMHPNNGLTVF